MWPRITAFLRVLAYYWGGGGPKDGIYYGLMTVFGLGELCGLVLAALGYAGLSFGFWLRLFFPVGVH